MTNLKDKIKNSWNWIKENPKKSVLGIGLAGLIATTALKDNVHFGSVTLNNPQENHYVWGIIPETYIEGENSKGNIYTFGLVGGGNVFGKNFQITGNMSVYSLLVGVNGLGDNSQITGNMGAYSLGYGINLLGKNSKITGNISNKGIFAGNNVSNKASFVVNDVAGFSFGSNDVKGLENYVHKVEENK